MGAMGRKRAERWTWWDASKKILQRVTALSKEPIRRFQQQLDCVVLVEVESQPDEAYLNSLRTMTQSIQRNSYAQLAMVLWGREISRGLEPLAVGSVQTEVWQEADLASVLHRARAQFQAPFLAVVSEPLLFSKQWLGQISAASGQIGPAAKIIAPSINIETAEHHVRYEGAEDEFSFQRFSRALWRKHRGQHQEISSVPVGCSVLSWDCLSLQPSMSWSSCRSWQVALQQSGTKIYWVKDTYVASLAALSVSPNWCDLTTQTETTKEDFIKEIVQR